MKKAYSANNEEFNCSDVDDVLSQMSCDGVLFVGAIYYEVDVEDVDLASYLISGRVLDIAAESVYDDIGEAAEDAFSVPKEALEEWDEFVSSWVKKHMHGSCCWKCVGKPRELTVTADDVEQFEDVA